VVHANGTNVDGKDSTKKFAWITLVRCVGHTLQLRLSELNKNPRIFATVSGIQQVVKHFKHREVAMTTLEKKQKKLGVPVHNLIHDVTTRWNSIYEMNRSRQ